MATLQEKLDKIKSPRLQNQQHTSVVLSAVEDTLRDQKADFTATAYFAALLALLGQAITSTGIVNKDLATSVVYLLDTVTTHVPAPLLRSKFSQILTNLVPALSLSTPDVEAPLLRFSIGCLESLLVAQDSAAWNLPVTTIGPRRALAGLLSLAVHHRPKVRKRAQDAVIHVLKNPPPTPSLDHPAADMCAETALRTLSESIAASQKARKAGGSKHAQVAQAQQHEPAISHALQLVKTIATASGGWPSKKIEVLCGLLMNVSRSSNEYLTMGAFEVFEAIFEGMADDFASAKLPRLMEAIGELKPAQNDSQLLPPWIAVLSRGYDVSAQISPDETFDKLPELFELVASYLSSPSHNIRVSASECLVSFMVNCVPDSVILEPSVYDEKTLEKLAKLATDLLSLRYQAAWAEVFKVITAMLESFKWRATPGLNEAVKIIGDLRTNESFHGKKEADKVLGAAIAAMGPQVVLSILPLNITKPSAGQPGRVWLLPILRDHVSNTNLAFFREEFIPMSAALYERVAQSSQQEKTVEVKIFETLIQQTWQVLPGFCELPLDLTKAFDQPFAEQLASVLYAQTDLRTDICKALQNLVESFQAIVELTEEDDLMLQRRISKETASKNLAHLATFSGNLLAVLFNVYSQTLPQFRGYILRCINAYLSITKAEELSETFTRVITLLEQALKDEAAQGKPQKAVGDKMPPTSHTLLDLIVTMSIYLPRSSFATLFAMASTILNRDAAEADTQLTKKAYKLIPRLATVETGIAALQERSTELQAMLIATADKTPAPARRDRILAIDAIVSHLPSTQLRFIPSILPEVVLGCKETNEKARTAAFNLVILMAKKMAENAETGAMIRISQVAHMPNDAADVPASLAEFFTMVSAGLAGSSPHMVAASVAALARLLFEFYKQLSTETLTDLVATLDLFLTSKNREIVRSVLGFVKVAIVVLPEELLRPRLSSLVPNLMVWSKEHKGRLKAKVKGILDRLIRRFGAQYVETLVGEQDRKVVVNIRKDRERRKRKKKEGAKGGAGSDEEEAGEGEGKRAFSNEFDKAVYGSDSDFSDVSDSDASELDVDEQGNLHKRGGSAAQAGGRRKDGRSHKAGEQYIRELSPEDNPLDLLAPDTLVNISTTKPSVRFLNAGKKQKKHAAKYDVDGKLILGDGNGDVAMAGAAPTAGADAVSPEDAAESINAYISAVSGPDAIRRGQRGKLRASQSGVGKKKGDEMDIDSDDEAGSKGSASRASGAGRKPQRRGLGEEKSRNSGVSTGRWLQRRAESDRA
ncbi:hypothetical protein KEM52_000053 [Ascosphaera acerosa]|nr:hypothetical protein KEM52_000053 [Ascosphaera acerosa]